MPDLSNMGADGSIECHWHVAIYSNQKWTKKTRIPLRAGHHKESAGVVFLKLLCPENTRLSSVVLGKSHHQLAKALFGDVALRPPRWTCGSVTAAS